MKNMLAIVLVILHWMHGTQMM